MRIDSLLLLAAVVTAPALLSGSGAEGVRDTRVINFPETQRVEGTVRIEGHAAAARQISFDTVVVPPGVADNPARMVDLGLIDATGFRAAVVSVSGEFSISTATGSVGVLLLPAEAFFQEAFRDRGHALLSLGTQAVSDPDVIPDFAAASPSLPLAFSQYRVFVYNTGKPSARANVAVYLTN